MLPTLSANFSIEMQGPLLPYVTRVVEWVAQQWEGWRFDSPSPVNLSLCPWAMDECLVVVGEATGPHFHYSAPGQL